LKYFQRENTAHQLKSEMELKKMPNHEEKGSDSEKENQTETERKSIFEYAQARRKKMEIMDRERKQIDKKEREKRQRELDNIDEKELEEHRRIRKAQYDYHKELDRRERLEREKTERWEKVGRWQAWLIVSAISSVILGSVLIYFYFQYFISIDESLWWVIPAGYIGGFFLPAILLLWLEAEGII